MTQKPRKAQQKYIDLGDRGRYCIHIKLNDLTGKEWIIYSKSFKVIHAPTLEEFFEIIAEKQITFFTKRNQTVLELLSHSDIIKKVCEKIERNINF